MTFANVAGLDKWELAHWVALFRLDPPDRQQANVRNALLCATVANHAFGSKGGAKVADFTLDFDTPSEKSRSGKVSEADKWLRWTAMCGGTIKQT